MSVPWHQQRNHRPACGRQVGERAQQRGRHTAQATRDTAFGFVKVRGNCQQHAQAQPTRWLTSSENWKAKTMLPARCDVRAHTSVTGQHFREAARAHKRGRTHACTQSLVLYCLEPHSLPRPPARSPMAFRISNPFWLVVSNSIPATLPCASSMLPAEMPMAIIE